MPQRYSVRIDDGTGNLTPFSLAIDDKGKPLWKTSLLNPIQQGTTIQGEISYANFLPRISGVFSQSDLSGGMGYRYQRTAGSPFSNTYYYAEWMDASVPGQVMKGPAVKTLTAPANSGPMTGYFELGGVPYLVLQRIIAKYNSGSDTLTQVRDLGGGNINAGGAVFNKDGTETASDTSTTTGASDSITSSDVRIAQQIRTNTAGINYLGRIDVLLSKVGLAVPPAPTVTVVGTTGSAHYSYCVTAIVPGGETTQSPTTAITNGNATLSTTDYNVIAVGTPTAGASGYNVYRLSATNGATGAGATLGKIGILATLGVFLDTGVPGDGTSPPGNDTSNQIGGNVRLTLQTDLNGKPSGTILDSASVLAKTLSYTPTVVTFRFDDGQPDATSFAVVYNEPFWIVLDCALADTNQTVVWTKSSTSSYTRGVSAVTTDGANSWTANGAGIAYYFAMYVKPTVETAFIGSGAPGNAFATTTDGSSYTPDGYRISSLFTVVGDRLIRNVSAGGGGAIEYTTDGTNWSEALPIGDINQPITWMGALGQSLIVCKADSIWAVDITNATITGVQMLQLYYTNPYTSNGQGSCYWKGTIFVPINGRVVAVRGDFLNGWQVFNSVGPEALQEWDFPWGPGHIVALCGDRFHLYGIMSTSGPYRLLKSHNPIEPLVNGEPSRAWHGALAQIGDGTQTITEAHIFDPGGTGNPRLFCTTTSNNIAEIVLERFDNPANDPNFLFDTSTVGALQFVRAHGNFPVHPKAWLNESITFVKRNAGDYADVMYDLVYDQEGFRRLGRIYDTGVLPFAQNIASTVIDRRLMLSNANATVTPVVQVSALTYAVRAGIGVPLRQIEFTIDAEDGQSAYELGNLLGLTANSEASFLDVSAISGGTRTLVDHRGRVYNNVLIRDIRDALVAEKAEGGSRAMIEVEAVQVG